MNPRCSATVIALFGSYISLSDTMHTTPIVFDPRDGVMSEIRTLTDKVLWT